MEFSWLVTLYGQRRECPGCPISFVVSCEPPQAGGEQTVAVVIDHKRSVTTLALGRRAGQKGYRCRLSKEVNPDPPWDPRRSAVTIPFNG